MRPDRQAREERQRSTGGGVVVCLGEVEDHERLPHGLAVVGAGCAGGEDAEKGAESD